MLHAAPFWVLLRMKAIVTWPHRLGLSAYASVFLDNEVDLDFPRSLSEGDLLELGLSLCARREDANR